MLHIGKIKRAAADEPKAPQPMGVLLCVSHDPVIPVEGRIEARIVKSHKVAPLLTQIAFNSGCRGPAAVAAKSLIVALLRNGYLYAGVITVGNFRFQKHSVAVSKRSVETESPVSKVVEKAEVNHEVETLIQRPRRFLIDLQYPLIARNIRIAQHQLVKMLLSRVGKGDNRANLPQGNSNIPVAATQLKYVRSGHTTTANDLNSFADAPGAPFIIVSIKHKRWLLSLPGTLLNQERGRIVCFLFNHCDNEPDW